MTAAPTKATLAALSLADLRELAEVVADLIAEKGTAEKATLAAEIEQLRKIAASPLPTCWRCSAPCQRHALRRSPRGREVRAAVALSPQNTGIRPTRRRPGAAEAGNLYGCPLTSPTGASSKTWQSLPRKGHQKLTGSP